MRHRGNDGRRLRQVVPGGESNAVFVPRFARVRHGLMDDHARAVGFQLADHVDDARIAQIRAIFLEGEAQHDDWRVFYLPAVAHEILDCLLRDELAHAVVDPPPRHDDFRVVAKHLGLVSQIIRIHADAVPADEAGAKRQEIPLGTRRLKDLQRVDADPVENDRQLVHQRDIEVTLRVLDDLGRFRDLDARRGMNTRRDDACVNIPDAREGFRRVARDDLDDPGQRAFLVARIDPLRRIADEKVLLPGKAGLLLDDRDADFLGRSGIDRRFENDGRAAFQVSANGARSADQR